MNSKSQVEQTAVVAPESGPPLAERTSATGLTRAQLRNLSVEHAAIAMQLSPRQLDLVLCLGRGFKDIDIARRTGLTLNTVRSYMRDLARETGMTRLGLAVLGYRLTGQERIEWQAAA